jgi:membrane-associated protease RseP (regulator of RpoE activity)
MSRRRYLPWILFFATCLSTWQTGVQYIDFGPLTEPEIRRLIASWSVWDFAVRGLAYAIPVMLILTAHEFGHYLQAVRYRVPASPPFFIPMPFNPFGTMGAIIFQQPGVATRRQLFDIAVSGPLAGLVLTIPFCLYGLSQSRIVDILPGVPRTGFGDPLLLKWMAMWMVGPLGPRQDYILNPMLMAGWVGMFITALNLIPIGQLDGGHLLYCLVGRRAHRVARMLFVALFLAVVVGGYFYDERLYAWTLMLALVALTGTAHPPTADDRERLGATRTVVGWLTLGFLPLGFTPIPILG